MNDTVQNQKRKIIVTGKTKYILTLTRYIFITYLEVNTGYRLRDTEFVLRYMKQNTGSIHILHG